jgi:GntR family histidine utilization transcriptional repressor
VQSAILQIPDLKAEVEKRGERYGYRLLELHKRAASVHDKARLGVGGRATVLALCCCHEAEGQPFAVEDRLINVQAVPDALKQDFAVTPPNTWLVGHVPWTEAEHRITACNADKRVAADLGIDPGAACLVIERRTWRNGEPITAVRITHPGQLYDLIARFTPTG